MFLSTAHSIRTYPAIGEQFEIVFYGDYRGNQPLEIVRRIGYDRNGWAHNGPLVEGRSIRFFKLVELRGTLTFDEACAELAQHGKVPEGQWVSGFKATFPKPDGNGAIGIADATWVAPDGRLNFLYVGRGGDLKFHRASGTFGPNWRWIVPA